MDYTYKATVIRVIDGDTIWCDIDLGFYMTARMPVRLAHINTPELNQAGGQDAKEHLKVLLAGGKVLLRTYKPRDKYGRYLADVLVDYVNINYQMIADGHAVAYEGSGS
jgi:micrococcal nuclease